MITDLVEGGSVNSPSLLFDEQDLYTESDEQPTSKSWKPSYTMSDTAYHIVLDLGENYDITKINLHDMHNSYNFTVAYGDGTNWTTLFVDPCDNFNTWSIHEVDITARYLRFSMYDNVYASVNEIFIYGKPNSSSLAKTTTKNKTSSINISKSTLNIETLNLYPNPVNKKLNIVFPLKMTGKNKLTITDLLGRTIYCEDILISTNTQITELTSNQLPKTNGIYTLSILHESGVSKTLKFLKK